MSSHSTPTGPSAPSAGAVPTKSAPSGPPEVQLRQACAELEERVRAGEDGVAKALLATYPDVAFADDLAVDLICTEFALRQQLGQQLQREEWYARFPQYRDRLEQQFRQLASLVESVPPNGVTAPELPRPDAVPPPRRPLAGGWAPPRYELLEQLGRGGMGEVYKARDLLLGRLVALKRIRTDRAGPAEVQRFHREAEAVAALRHRHLVPLYDFSEHEGEPFFTMAFVGGGNLATRLTEFADPRAAVQLVEKVARAVQAAHEQGIVHRDLKPTNVFIDEEREPLVGDFGLAKFLDAAPRGEVTLTGSPMGTPAYMAPEQAAGHGKRATPATDVWALGVLLYEILTGHKPFSGDSQQVIQRILKATPESPRRLRPELDRGLETIILKCLDKDQAWRYPSAGALADDLEGWLRGERRALPPWYRRAGRVLRRRAALLGAVILAATLATALLLTGEMFGRRAASPPRRDPIELLGPQGLLPGGRLLLGQGAVAPQGNGAVRVLSEGEGPGQPGAKAPSDLVLVELLASAPWDRYRLRVNVQDVGKSGTVGIYVACQEQAVPSGHEYWFYDLRFAERNEVQQRVGGEHWAPVILEARRVAEPHDPQSPSFDHHNAVPPDRFFKAAEGSWRQLVLEVTPTTVCAFWEGEAVPFAYVAHTAMMQQARDTLAALPPVRNPRPPAVGTKGGVGLICVKGEALFHGAVLEPLPEEK